MSFCQIYMPIRIFSAIIRSAMLQARVNAMWTQSLGSAVLEECGDEF
jgi:hypothetical protein